MNLLKLIPRKPKRQSNEKGGFVFICPHCKEMVSVNCKPHKSCYWCGQKIKEEK